MLELLIRQYRNSYYIIKLQTPARPSPISYRAPPSAHNPDRKDSPCRIRQDHLLCLRVVVKLAVSVTQIKTNVSIFRFIEHKYNRIKRKTQRHGLKRFGRNPSRTTESTINRRTSYRGNSRPTYGRNLRKQSAGRRSGSRNCRKQDIRVS